MITIECQVSGGQIARHLCGDDEEMAYALAEMVKCEAQGMATGVAECLPYGTAPDVIKMLRDLADYIEREFSQPRG